MDTAPAWQRHGLGFAVARALVARLESTGLGAVWGAYESNAASLGLAARLGFTPAARITVFEHP